MAQAALADEATSASAPKTNPCSQIKLTDAQKTQIKAARANFETANAPLKAAIKTARSNYYKMAVDPKSDSALAATSSQAVTSAVTKELDARQTLKTEVLFNVLTQEQRGPFLKCQALRKKFRRGHHQHHTAAK